MGDRRRWTYLEEELLIRILEDIVTSGGRGDRGCFRPGTYETIVSKMREKIPNINITSKNVLHKIKRLKNKYSAAYDMLNTRGFRWDDAKQCVTTDDKEVLDEYLKNHPTNNYTINSPFPKYEQLKLLFGKDHTTRNVVESAADALGNMGVNNENDFDTKILALPPISSASYDASVASDPSDGEGSTRQKKRKVNSSDKLAQLVEEIKHGLQAISDQMRKLVTVISDSEPSMDGLMDELKEIGLDVTQIIRMGMYFGDKPAQLRLWKTLDGEMKQVFVKIVLESNK